MSEAADATVAALQAFAGELRDISSSIEQQLHRLKTGIHRCGAARPSPASPKTLEHASLRCRAGRRCRGRDVDELQHALELRRAAMLQRADDVTTQMAAAVFKQEEQVLKDVAVYVRVLPAVNYCIIMLLH